MDLIPASRIASSGLQAERTRMEVAAHNLANAHASSNPDGSPFQRSLVLLEARQAAPGKPQHAGVEVAGITQDRRPPKEIYAPGHPDADAAGMVRMPNITPMEELLDMITASRSYEANLTVMRQGRQMAERTIDRLRRN